jgi:nucleoside-triphosphatase
MEPVYLLTGRPGTGKTSLIKQALSGFELRAGGFYTEEIRSRGTREGFKLVTLDGQEAVMAHVNFGKRLNVGKYGVDVESLDNVGVPALRRAASECDLVIIDEIGKMELLSVDFREAVLEIIDSGKSVLGTIMLHANPWADKVKRHPRVKLATITANSRQQALDDLRGWLRDVKTTLKHPPEIR